MNEPCGCCAGVAPLTPLSLVNRPGLPALAYRVGTHGSFLATMLARLASGDFPALAGLTARTGDDPAIALLDAWATVADVLTFYQERIANEGYLRTATERRSILELARLVGYTLRPGVAASTYLAYTLDKDPQPETTVTIPQGSRAQSVPAGGELPQTFETSDDLAARYAWNNLQPRLTRPTRLTQADAGALATLYFTGITTGLRPNDPLLLVFGPGVGEQVLLQVKTVTPEPMQNRTAVTLQVDDTARFAALLDDAQTAVQRARDLQQANVGASRLAQRLDADVLAPLAEALAGLTPRSGFVALSTLLALAVPPVQEALAFVTARGYPNLTAWLTATAGDLQTVLAAAGQGAAGAATNAPVSLNQQLGPAAAGANGAELAAAGLGALLGPLQLPPSLPPRQARDLVRSVQTQLGSGSDMEAQLLVALKPALATTLYPAWANATVAPPAELQSIQALRVKAAPFGATAPRRPVLDDRGAVVGSTEWPLAGSIATSVRITYDGNRIPRQADVTLTQGGEAASVRVALPGTQHGIQVRGSRVDVDDDEGHERTLTFTFTSGAFGRRIVIVQRGDLAANFAVTFDNDPGFTWQPALDQTLRDTSDDSQFTVGLTRAPNTAPGDNFPGTLVVSAETLLAPDPRTVLPLDAQYDQIVPEGWIVVERADQSGQPLVTQVTKVATVARNDYNLSGKITQLTLVDPWLVENDRLLSVARGTTVYVQSESLVLAPEPVDDDVQGGVIELDGLYAGLQSGRWLIVTGERTDIPGTTGVRAAELAMLAGTVQAADPTLPGDTVHTYLLLAAPLAYRYQRDTVTVWGNVVKATHGETRTEVLGSGSGARALQTFALRQSSLTYIAAPTPAGAASTLEVRVDGVRWHEVDSLVWAGPTDHVYVTRTGDDNKTTVITGNGRYGARPASGAENITAGYRAGIGRGGNVKAEQIRNLQSRPLGVNSVINPLPATGGADRESQEQARSSVPLGLLALDRLVSVPDYAAFARTFAGIGKASARRLSDGRREVVHLTIAGAGDIPIALTSDLYRNLRLALLQYGDPAVTVQVAVRELALLVLSAGVRVAPDYLWALVEPQVRAALLAAFSFDRRDLGQDLFLSEAIAVMQAAPGVAYVDVDACGVAPETITPAALPDLIATFQPPQQRIPVELARFEEQTHTVAAGETLTAIAAQYGLTLADLLRLNPGLTDATLIPGQVLTVFRGLRPARLALLSPALPDTLILKEIKG
ncbi:MAG TPA: putative baseplate assembly protein [Thermomicrobiales bacterium]|nr:putative baseplate assembly protein [Thermomicrobiales bacterium]